MRERKPCLECPTLCGPRNKTGYCIRCSGRRLALALRDNPEQAQKRREGLRRYFAEPGNRQRHTAFLRDRSIGPEERERRAAWGRELHRTVIMRPDVQAKLHAPETKRKAGASRTERVLGWCPPELRDDYRRLVMAKHMSPDEARATIEEMIPGTQAHAKRLIANTNFAMRIKQEREKAQAY